MSAPASSGFLGDKISFTLFNLRFDLALNELRSNRGGPGHYVYGPAYCKADANQPEAGQAMWPYYVVIESYDINHWEIKPTEVVDVYVYNLGENKVDLGDATIDDGTGYKDGDHMGTGPNLAAALTDCQRRVKATLADLQNLSRYGFGSHVFDQVFSETKEAIK